MTMLMMMPISKNVDNPLESSFRVLFLVYVDGDTLSFGERLITRVSDIAVEFDKLVGLSLIWLLLVESPNTVRGVNGPLARNRKTIKSHARGLL